MDKHVNAIFTKWDKLKKIYNAIKSYRCRSGCHWDNTNGANVATPSEKANWQSFLASNTSQAREMAPFSESGWIHYPKMQQLCASGGAQGVYTLEVGEEADVAESISDFGSSATGSNSQPTGILTAPTISLQSLLQLAPGIVSLQATTQVTTIHDIISMLQSIASPSKSFASPKRTFS
ncbi:hypothetical protein JVU11DRAFT_3774 [Chiua virens]|nr:hypothetical protein JVU11DRAFT_3774 [Chiua virens]